MYVCIHQIYRLFLALSNHQFPEDPRTGDDGAESYAAVVAERDELLTVRRKWTMNGR